MICICCIYKLILGLAKLLDHQDWRHIIVEYLSRRRSFEKADVFGFGTLHLEMRTVEFGKSIQPKGSNAWFGEYQFEKYLTKETKPISHNCYHQCALCSMLLLYFSHPTPWTFRWHLIQLWMNDFVWWKVK